MSTNFFAYQQHAGLLAGYDYENLPINIGHGQRPTISQERSFEEATLKFNWVAQWRKIAINKR